MPLVLIPTDQTLFIAGQAEAYARRGFDVAVGTRNFFLRTLHADLVHYHLPEEFSRFRLPTSARLAEIREAADWWARRGPTLMTVHNLYPHGYENDPVAKELYSIFYNRCRVVVHSSRASRDLVLDEFPAARDKHHAIAHLTNHDRLVPAEPDRPAWRRHFGYTDDDFVILVFGTIRFWTEIRLIQAAYGGARVPNKQLLMAGRYARGGTRWPPPAAATWRDLHWRLWLRWNGSHAMRGYIPDTHVHRYLEAADAIIVPRLKDLTSGLVGLGMTFGRIVIAPSHGVYRECLAGTENPIYESGNPESLARAIERAAALDRHRVEVANRRLAAQWTWDSVVTAGLEAVRHAGHGRVLSNGSSGCGDDASARPS